MPTIHDKVQAVRTDLNTVLLERSSAIDNALLALLTKQHFLQLGPTGSAKSLLVDALHKCIVGTKRFKRGLNPATTPDELLGPVDLIQMADHGRYVRRHARSILEADIAFLDELGRVNQVVYDLLLQILNEREVDEIGMDAPIKLPLISVFGASNTSLTGNENLNAINDRFLLREIVDYVTEEQSLIALFTAPPNLATLQATLTLQELQQAQQAIFQVKGTPEVLQAALTLKQALSREGIMVSDRMWTWSSPLLKARAWLDGRPELDMEDLTCLIYSWWSDPKELKAAQRAIYQVACPLYLRALELEDQGVEVFRKMPKDDDQDFPGTAENCLQQLADIEAALVGDIKMSSARSLDKPKASLGKIQDMRKQVAKQLFERISRLSLAV